MPIRVKEKANDLITIRCGNPMEKSWMMNYLNSAKRFPDHMRPPISVKDYKGDEIKLPPPPKPPEDRAVTMSGQNIITSEEIKIQLPPEPIKEEEKKP